jgi:isoleucyl-tRNA synthetase
MARFEKLPNDVQAREAQVLQFWESRRIFEKTLEKTRSGKPYVFYEGPPTANGKPHFGHLMPRVYKDLFPRYQTMKGRYVLRKGGWDTHGLPVELEVERALGLNSKQEIEKYGIEKFAKKCQESVWKYKGEWERMIRRMGFWIDLDKAYITYTPEYIESVWWALKRIWEQGLLYKGHKVLPYCPRCGTPLSSHEVAQGYEEVTEPAVTVKFRLRGREKEYLLAWTTTPWTLPGNVALAVGADIDYLKVAQKGETYYLAEAVASQVLQGDYEVLGKLKGAEMEGWEYEPLLPFLHDALADASPRAWYVATADFVSTEEGSGIVHTAVMYGEEDYQLGERLGLPQHHTVDENGRFTPEVKPWAGKFVKDADPEIVKYLKGQGLLYRVANYTHTYPFCWRCDTPLLYYALDSWFIKTTARQRKIIENNQAIQWHPEHMRDGRFGNFLDSMKDWALSRDRYWGTPLPIWICERCARQLCVGSRAELVEHAQNPEEARDVEPHKPYIDRVQLDCPECHGPMSRVPQVIDTWFDSGMMHTAQWHAPFEHEKEFQSQFPADFICEALDQTRGWFYTLLVTSTLLYPDKEYPHPYRHVMVTGMGLNAQGKKMSKSEAGSGLDPMEMVDALGADTMRWYLYSSSAPWRDRVLTREDAAKVLHGFLNTLSNVYNFFALYASIDAFDPQAHHAEPANRPLLDRWLLSRLQGTAAGATQALEAYDVVAATQVIERFVDDLSNWYLRLSRSRFWGEGLTPDKISGYATLHEALVTLAQLLAPFVPFLSESLYQQLGALEGESVHLCDYPQAKSDLIDLQLEDQMALARQVVTLGRAARNNAKIKVRQPLMAMKVGAQHAVPLPEALQRLVLEELNVKRLEFTAENLRARYLKPQVTPLMEQIGPKFGPLAPKVKRVLAGADMQKIAEELEGHDRYVLTVDGQTVELTRAELSLEYRPEPGAAVGFDEVCIIVLDTEVTPELRMEGYVRELVHHIQQLRKEAGYEVSDRIELYLDADPELTRAVTAHQAHVQGETLAVALHTEKLPAKALDHVSEVNVNGLQARVGLKRRN